MVLLILPIIGLIGWLLLDFQRISNKNKKVVTIVQQPYEPSTSSQAARARECNRKLREELEAANDAKTLAQQPHTEQKKDKEKYFPPWFIGTWGINEPSHAEQLIINELVKYDIKWYREVSFSDLKLPSGGNPRFDFYLPKYKTAIEYQGQGWHNSQERVMSDNIKKKLLRGKWNKTFDIRDTTVQGHGKRYHVPDDVFGRFKEGEQINRTNFLLQIDNRFKNISPFLADNIPRMYLPCHR